MPTYTFETRDGNGVSDSSTLQFADDDAASKDAQIALAEMVRDHLPDGERADFSIVVKNTTGAGIYRASIVFVSARE